jgi:hypothetical protein
VTDPTTREMAMVMIREAREAIANGTRHYDREGRLLQTPEQIIRTLLDEGQVRLEARDADER